VLGKNLEQGSVMSQVRLKMYIQHTILAILPSTYQNLLNFMEIWQSSDRNKNAKFFKHSVVYYVDAH